MEGGRRREKIRYYSPTRILVLVLTKDGFHGLLVGAGDDFLPPGGRTAGVLVLLQQVEDVDLEGGGGGGREGGREGKGKTTGMRCSGGARWISGADAWRASL